ncbi:MAG: hypothetical protein RR404_01930 [Bacilli bacterium]
MNQLLMKKRNNLLYTMILLSIYEGDEVLPNLNNNNGYKILKSN